MTDIRLFPGSSTACDADATDNARLQDYYRYWRKKYLRPSQQVSGGAYVDYQANQTTCSEAHGYGMLISLYMAKFDTARAQQDFAALNHFRKQFPSRINPRLMAWQVDDKTPQPAKTTCATDGDLDIAYALLLAACTWKEPAYLVEAMRLIEALETTLIRPDFSLKRGDWDNEEQSVRLSDIMPTHFDAFAQVSNRGLWEKTKRAHYELLREVARFGGAFPDFVIRGKAGWEPAPAHHLEGDYDGMMYYNACRVPWRLASAALENNDREAQHLLKIFDRGIGQVCNSQFMAGYNLQGEALNDWTDGAFTAPHMCSLRVNQRTHDLQEAKEQQFSAHETYYQDSLRLLALCLVTGNTFTLKCKSA